MDAEVFEVSEEKKEKNEEVKVLLDVLSAKCAQIELWCGVFTAHICV